MPPVFEILRASPADAPALAGLFDAYRCFYGQASDPALAETFLTDRRAAPSGGPAGFTQLYPSFSSVSAAPIWILNDLFVDPAHRGKRIAHGLMNAAYAHARSTGAIRLELSTTRNNKLAQSLYESIGYSADEGFIHYSLPIPPG